MLAQDRRTISVIRSLLEEGASGADVLADAVARAERAAAYGAFLSLAAGRGTVGLNQGPLSGVPFAVKDNIDTADLPTTGGTPSLDGSYPSKDAPIVATLRGAGAQLVGKTNLHELAFGVTSNNAAFGPVRNAHDPARSAGGSSGGTAAAVALGVVPFALGTDTGGSMRIPAAHCGVIGFRPTTGRWGAAGVLPLSSSRDTIGVMANSVADVATVDEAISGANGAFRPDTGRVRLGIPRPGFYHNLNAEVAVRTERALGALANARYELVEMEVVGAHELDARCGIPIVFYEVFRDLPRYLRGLSAPFGRLTFRDVADRAASPDVKGLLQAILAQPVHEAHYAELLKVREELKDAYTAAFVRNQVAALVYPTVPLPAPPLGDDDTTAHNGSQVPVFVTSIQNTAPGSVAGVPSISLPNGTTAAGLPVGLSLEAPAGTDRNLLALAAAIDVIVTDA